jgi:hypothetical protein
MPLSPRRSTTSPALPSRDWTRRRLIQAGVRAGTVGFLGLGLGDLAALRAGSEVKVAGGSRPRAGRARSVIYIFLSGGLSQIDSFDMKPEASAETRGEFRPIPTRTPGVAICEHLPLLAARSETWALVRSLTHPYNDHSQGHMVMLSGRTPLPAGFDPNQPKPTDWPSVAAVAHHATRPRGGLPPSVVLPQLLVHRTGRVIPGQFAGLMGSRWDPFLVDAAAKCMRAYGACPDCFHHETGKFAHTAEPVFQMPSLTLPVGLDEGRLARRVGLLRLIEGQQRVLEGLAQNHDVDRHRESAIALLANPRAQWAFNVRGAPDVVQERYGRNQFGWSLLMARRLVEHGVNLVQVNLGNNETWDTHQSAFPNLKDFLFPPFDRALSALIDDLGDSGLLESTLVVVAGEFGRTPRISTLPGAALPGRDHWGAVQTVLFAGGGVRGGTVIGASDRVGAHPAKDPETPESMAATMYEALGVPREAQWKDLQGRPYPVYNGEPIPGLLA